MSISPISAPSTPTPPPKPEQTSTAAPDAQIAAQKAKTDTVKISKQAQLLASDGDTAAQEAKESAAEKASETLRGKK